MVDWSIGNIKLYNQWFYFKLRAESAEDEVDLITWKQVILRQLKEYYGKIGESMPFDLLHQIDPRTVIIRCSNEDKDTFTNAMISSISTINGVEYSITTISKSAYLNGVV